MAMFANYLLELPDIRNNVVVDIYFLPTLNVFYIAALRYELRLPRS